MMERFRGAIFGLAIGDALGYPAEFRSRAQILASFPPNGLQEFVGLHDSHWPQAPAIMGTSHPPGTYTDDTQMSVCVARALLEAGTDDLDRLMQTMGQNFVAWSQSIQNDRAPGGTCMTGCSRLARGIPWAEAGVKDSKGCGSAMRVAPIGLYLYQDKARLLEVARASSILTHGHDAAIEGAAAAALLVALALQDTPPEAMYEAVTQECAPHSADFRQCWEKLPAMLHQPPEIALSKAGLGEAWIAEEAVASAMYCYWRSPQDFRQIMETAINTDGDSDSIACIAGGIAGAALGEQAIPEHWRRDIEDRDMLAWLGEQLWQAASTSD